MKEKRNFIISAVVLVAVIVVGSIAYNTLQPKAQQTSTASLPTAASSTSSSSSSGSSGSTGTTSSSAQSSSKVATGKALADFTVLDASGAQVKLSSLQGKPTIIGVWATWCPYCVKEAPAVQTLYETYGDRVNFMMIDMVDGQRETIDTGKQWIAQNGYTYPVYFDTDLSASRATEAYYLPTTIILKADGTVYTKLSSAVTVSTVSPMFDKLLS